LSDVRASSENVALVLRVPLLAIASLAVVCGGCRLSGDDKPEPLATRSSAPIAFLRDQGTEDAPHQELVVIEHDGSNERTVQLPRGYDVESFSWSLDGRRLVFPANPPDDYRPFLYVANADGSGVRKLIRLRDYLSFPVWSPRGDKIAFDMQDDGYHAVWVINADGSGARRLTPGYDFSYPVWSPDGKKIAYGPYQGRGGGHWVVNVDGSGRKRLAARSEPDWSKPPSPIRVGRWESAAFSRDGRTVAFSGRILPGGDWELAVVRNGQEKVRRLTDNDRHDMAPSFSPDGKSLAFQRFTPPPRGEYPVPPGDIYLINVDGSGERNLTDSEENEFAPAWAPEP
jgi:Tol biopolymer transport system component